MTVRTRLKGLHMNSLCVQPQGLILAHLSTQPWLLGSWIICLCSVFQCLQGLSLCNGFVFRLFCCGGLLIHRLWPDGPLLHHGFLLCLLWLPALLWPPALATLLWLPALPAPPWLPTLPALLWLLALSNPPWTHAPLFHSLSLFHGPGPPMRYGMLLLHGPGPPLCQSLPLHHCPGPLLIHGLLLLHGAGPQLCISLPLLHGSGPPSLPLFCLRSTSLLDLCLFCLRIIWKPLLKGGWLCPAGVPTSSSRGHSIQNLYHCLTKSISQYTPCLISYTAGFNQEDYLRHTHTHYIAKSCFNASGHYWAFNSVFIALFMTLDCFSVYCDCLLPDLITARFGLLFCFALDITVCWCWIVPV